MRFVLDGEFPPSHLRELCECCCGVVSYINHSIPLSPFHHLSSSSYPILSYPILSFIPTPTPPNRSSSKTRRKRKRRKHTIQKRHLQHIRPLWLIRRPAVAVLLRAVRLVLRGVDERVPAGGCGGGVEAPAALGESALL
jgi:hypothetical protein